MILLDTHEIDYEDDEITVKRDSKRGFLYYHFMDQNINVEIVPMEVGDYLSGEQIMIQGKTPYEQRVLCDTYFNGYYLDSFLKGNLVEIKIGKDFGIHTEQLERFQDECCRMANWRVKNPHVQLHAVWVDYFNNALDTLIIYQLFVNICATYHIWPHLQFDNEELIQFLTDLDTAKYTEFVPYIKRSHEEPTILAKMLRQFPRISSEMAIKLAKIIPSIHGLFYVEYNDRVRENIVDEIYDTIGRKKNGEPKKLAVDLIRWLETGEAP